MRICLISGEYPPQRGGVADYTWWLARHLARQGAEVAVLTSKAVKNKGEEMGGENGLRVLPQVEGWGLRSWPGIARTLRRLGADIAHLQYQTGAFAMAPAVNLLPQWVRRRTPCRFITTFHDLNPPYLFPKAGRLRLWANRFLLRWSDAAIITNEEDRRRAQGWAEGRRLHLIPIGSNLFPSPGIEAHCQQWRAMAGVEPGGLLLGHFGFLSEGKGVETLFQAIALLRKEGLAVKLLMVGGRSGDSDVSGGIYERGALRYLGELGLGEAVVWTGYLEPPEASVALLSVDTCVLPFAQGASFRHGTLMAALAHGLTLITTMPSVVAANGPRLISGENCLLVPPGDAAALVRAIAQLMASPDLRRHLSEGATQLAVHFSWETIAAQTMALYREVLERGVDP